MVKTLAIEDEFHTEIKLDAAKKGVGIKYHLTEIYDSQKRLSAMTRDLSQMKQGDAYRLVLDDKVIVLECVGSYEFQD